MAPRPPRTSVVLAALALALAGCGSGDGPAAAPPPRPATAPVATVPLLPELRAAAPVRVAAAGDIADRLESAAATAAVVTAVAPDFVLTTGDNAYGSGSAEDFATKYEPTWGRFKAITRPSPGNHDYRTPGAAGYFDYFAEQTGRAPYYAWNAGAWRFYSLNSEIDMAVGSPQERWLRADLAGNAGRNVLAYWHRPRFTCSSRHAPEGGTQPLWAALTEAGAELLLTGHNHSYERFEKRGPGGEQAGTGVREFVTGAGGADRYRLSEGCPGREAGEDDAYGVLELTLRPDGYAWAFRTVDGRIADAGSDRTG